MWYKMLAMVIGDSERREMEKFMENFRWMLITRGFRNLKS